MFPLNFAKFLRTPVLQNTSGGYFYHSYYSKGPIESWINGILFYSEKGQICMEKYVLYVLYAQCTPGKNNQDTSSTFHRQTNAQNLRKIELLVEMRILLLFGDPQRRYHIKETGHRFQSFYKLVVARVFLHELVATLAHFFLVKQPVYSSACSPQMVN